MSGAGTLGRAVDAFVVAVAPALTRLAGESRIGDTDQLAGDVALEAFNLTAEGLGNDAEQGRAQQGALTGNRNNANQ